MRTSLYRFALCYYTLGFSSPAISQSVSDSFCANAPYSFLYFNGVRTTELKARFNLKQIERAYASSTDYRQNILYDLAYNDSTFEDNSLIKFGWSDILETFEQRFSQQPAVIANRYELFFEALSGGGEQSSNILSASPQYGEFLNSLSDPIRARYVSALISANNRTLRDYADHQALIDSQINNGRPVLLYAHSQGNLFANQAYRYASLRVGANSVKIIHIAPASSEIYGNYVLADGDLVINLSLRQVAVLPAANSNIPPYSDRPAGVAFSGENGKDRLGHGLVEVYLNDKIQPFAVQPLSKSQGYVRTAISELVAPCPDGFIEYTYNNFSGRYILDGFDYGWFTPTSPDVSFTRTARIDKLKPGRHTFGILSQSPSGVPATLSVRTTGSYRLVDGSTSASGAVPAGGTRVFEFTVPPR